MTASDESSQVASLAEAEQDRPFGLDTALLLHRLHDAEQVLFRFQKGSEEVLLVAGVDVPGMTLADAIGSSDLVPMRAIWSYQMDSSVMQRIQLVQDAGSVLAETMEGDQARACSATCARPHPADVAPKFSGSEFAVLQMDLPPSVGCVPPIIGYGAGNRHRYGARSSKRVHSGKDPWTLLQATFVGLAANACFTRWVCTAVRVRGTGGRSGQELVVDQEDHVSDIHRVVAIRICS